jgi:conjugative transfer region protein TrbK
MREKFVLIMPVSLIFFVFILCACSPEQPSATDKKTIEYFKNNPDILSAEAERCKTLSPVDAANDPICQNVIKAQRRSLADDYTYKGPPPKKLLDMPGAK